MPDPPSRETADLSAYPDLVVISMYVDVAEPVGLGCFTLAVPATGTIFSARQRRDAEPSGS
jgi:hypothetical protein